MATALSVIPHAAPAPEPPRLEAASLPSPEQKQWKEQRTAPGLSEKGKWLPSGSFALEKLALGTRPPRMYEEARATWRSRVGVLRPTARLRFQRAASTGHQAREGGSLRLQPSRLPG